jgi:hypothetical protein
MDYGRGTEKLNVEHRTSNIECLMGKDEETVIGSPCSAMGVFFDSRLGVRSSMFDVHFQASRALREGAQRN